MKNPRINNGLKNFKKSPQMMNKLKTLEKNPKLLNSLQKASTEERVHKLRSFFWTGQTSGFPDSMKIVLYGLVIPVLLVGGVLGLLALLHRI